MEKALFDWPIVLQYDVKPKYQLISRKFSGVKSFHPTVRLTNQKPRTFCICSTNQSNRSISVRLLFLFCSRVFISRSYENRCNIKEKSCTVCLSCKIIKCKIVFACVPTPISLVSLLRVQRRNRLLPSSKNPHFQIKAQCTTFLVKMSFLHENENSFAYVKCSKAVHLTSF